ncbi:unnamed protein product, partial [Discosporangium mesarthrocarpum]
MVEQRGGEGEGVGAVQRVIAAVLREFDAAEAAVREVKEELRALGFGHPTEGHVVQRFLDNRARARPEPRAGTQEGLRDISGAKPDCKSHDPRLAEGKSSPHSPTPPTPSCSPSHTPDSVPPPLLAMAAVSLTLNPDSSRGGSGQAMGTGEG